jgi:hypothetical protein
MAGIYYLLFSSPVFWLGLIIPFITLFPDLCYIVIKKTCFKTLTDVIIEDEVASNSSEQTLFSETARLIRSFCDPTTLIKDRRSTSFTNIKENQSTVSLKNNDLEQGENSERRESKISVKKLMDRKRADSVISSTRDDVELKLGYAFSQEEKGVVSQEQLIRSYDTTKSKPSGV